MIAGEGTVLERGSVIVAGDRIVKVTEEAAAAGDARRIDASGKTVLPGLIDANVHLVMTVPGPEGQPRSEEELAARIRSELPERLTVIVEGKEHTVGPGGTAFVSPETWIALANRTDTPVVLLGMIPRGEVEECYRVLFSQDANAAARREAMALCRIRNG